MRRQPQVDAIVDQMAATPMGDAKIFDQFRSAFEIWFRNLPEVPLVQWYHRILTNTFKRDVEPLLAQVREEMGVPPDPIAAYFQSGYEGKVSKERVYKKTGSGYQ